MVITQPTVDDFSDTTVMRVIRKIVNYICNDLVDGINNNDIVSGQFSVQGNQLSGTLTKGDGTTIDIPAATLPGGGGGGSDNPYPTAISMSLSGTTLNFNMAMSNGTPITGSVDLAPILEGYATVSEVTAIKPIVTVNDSVSPPTISVTVNGSTSTANLPSGGTGSGPTFTVLDNTSGTSNNWAKFAEWVTNAKVGDNIKIIGKLGGTGQFIKTLDMSVVVRDDGAESIILVGNGTAEISSLAVQHNGSWIPITTLRIDNSDPSQPMFRGSVCYDIIAGDVVNVFFPFVFSDNTYVLLTSY